jgi:chromosome transmission fidelity protein 4
VPLTSASAKAGGRGRRLGEGNEEDEATAAADEDDNDNNDDEDDDDAAELRKLEQTYLLKGVQAAQLRDAVDAMAESGSMESTHSRRAALARLELDIDKALLQLLAIECRTGEERGPRALETVTLLRDRTGRMLEAAGKVAERYGRTILGEKIREVGEERLGAGLGRRNDDDDEFA